MTAVANGSADSTFLFKFDQFDLMTAYLASSRNDLVRGYEMTADDCIHDNAK